MLTFNHFITEAAIDKTRKPDNLGYTSGQYGEAMITHPPVLQFSAKCERLHENIVGTGTGNYITLVSFKSNATVAVRWICPKCKELGLTPYVQQCQIGQWLASALLVV